MDLVISGQRVITPAGVVPASVHIEAGKIVRVGAANDLESNALFVDAGNLIVMPGVVDTHVHVNEPGRTDWEGFESATRAAAAGGVTTILDMPLNSIPATTTVAALEAKKQSARGKTKVNVEYIGGLIPGNFAELEGLHRAGVRAFKCFLSPSGVEEFPAVSEDNLAEAFSILERLGIPLMVHAEDPALLKNGPPSGSLRYSDYLASRPSEAEVSAIEMLVRLCQGCRAQVHIVHLSSGSSLGVIHSARSRGLLITVETCPHYLTFAAEEISDGTTEFKCAPPIRESSEREALWEALIAGDIDAVVSDHSPCPPSLKESHSDFFGAWGGIASLQISLPAVWTGARARGISPERIAQWMSAGPAHLAGLGDRKGAIAEGYDADIVIWDPDRSFTVDPAALEHRHPVTPYAGRELFGTVIATYVGGTRAFEAQ